jgi:hypothetical protein
MKYAMQMLGLAQFLICFGLGVACFMVPDGTQLNLWAVGLLMLCLCVPAAIMFIIGVLEERYR